MAKRSKGKGGSKDVGLNQVTKGIKSAKASQSMVYPKAEYYNLEDEAPQDTDMPDMMIDISDKPEVTMLPDGVRIEQTEGSAYVDLDGDNSLYEEDDESEEEDNTFRENLAETLDEKLLDQIARDLIESVDNDVKSRAPWESFYSRGIKSLGLVTDNEKKAPFEGAADVVYPMLMDGVIQFQARALAELLPPSGAVKTIIKGSADKERKAQAKRVENYMNYQIMEEDSGYFDEIDQMLLYLPVGGSAFMKTYIDPFKDTVVSKFLRAEHVVVPYVATSLETAERITHIQYYSQNEMDKLQRSGAFRKVKLSKPSDNTEDTGEIQETDDAVDNKEKLFDESNDQYKIYETALYLDVENYGDDDSDGESKPYLIKVNTEDNKVLCLYRNWAEDDELYEPRQSITHFKYLPGPGFYGLGLWHAIGGLTTAATGALRAMLDTAAFAAMPGGFRASDVSMTGGDIEITPGKYEEVGLTAEELPKAFFTLPTKDVSPVLFNLLGLLIDAGNKTSSATEDKVGEGGANTPVGTELARIEQGSKVYSGIHKRLHNAARHQFKIRHDLTPEIIGPEGYEYEIEGESQTIMADDFDSRIDVIPVSDPNVMSSALRIAQSQAVLQLSEMAPDLYNRYEAHRRMLESQNISGIDEVLIDPTDVERLGPIAEIQALLMQRPVRAFRDQDHTAHITVITGFMEHPNFGGNPQVAEVIMPSLIALLAEHKAYEFGQVMGQAGAIVPETNLNTVPGEDIMEDEVSPEEEQLQTHIAAQVVQQFLQLPGAALPGDGEQEQPSPEQMKMEAEIGKLTAETEDIRVGTQVKAAESQANIQAQGQPEQQPDQTPEFIVKQQELQIKDREVGIKEQQSAAADQEKLERLSMEQKNFGLKLRELKQEEERLKADMAFQREKLEKETNADLQRDLFNAVLAKMNVGESGDLETEGEVKEEEKESETAIKAVMESIKLMVEQNQTPKTAKIKRDKNGDMSEVEIAPAKASAKKKVKVSKKPANKDEG